MTESPVEIPMAWLWAEFVADTLVATSSLRWAPATPEYRAVRDVLALSMLFTGVAEHGVPMTDADLEVMAQRMTNEEIWLLWCRAGLDGYHSVTLGKEDRRLAKDAWLWLINCQITPDREAKLVLHGKDIPLSCYRLGIDRARRVIAVHLSA